MVSRKDLENRLAEATALNAVLETDCKLYRDALLTGRKWCEGCMPAKRKKLTINWRTPDGKES